MQCIAYVWTILQKSTTRFAIKLAHRLDQYWTFWLLNMYSGNFLISVFNRRSLKTEQHFKSAGTGLGEQFNTKQAAAPLWCQMSAPTLFPVRQKHCWPGKIKFSVVWKEKAIALVKIHLGLYMWCIKSSCWLGLRLPCVILYYVHSKTKMDDGMLRQIAKLYGIEYELLFQFLHFQPVCIWLKLRSSQLWPQHHRHLHPWGAKLLHSGIDLVDCPTRWSLWYWYLDF